MKSKSAWPLKISKIEWTIIAAFIVTLWGGYPVSARLENLRTDFVPSLMSSISSPPQQRVTCNSDDMRRNWCSVDTRGGVRLYKQKSDSPCIQGRTWGYNRNGIWVDRGCRAEFQIGR